MGAQTIVSEETNASRHVNCVRSDQMPLMLFAESPYLGYGPRRTAKSTNFAPAAYCVHQLGESHIAHWLTTDSKCFAELKTLHDDVIQLSLSPLLSFRYRE